MNLSDFKKRGLVRKTQKDISLIKSLIKLSQNDEIVTRRIKLDDLSARMILINHYGILRMTLEAISINHNLKIYCHEAYVHFLKEIKEPLLAEKFDRFRKLRNKLSYYGEDLSVEEVIMIIGDVSKMIKHLKEKHLKEYISVNSQL